MPQRLSRIIPFRQHRDACHDALGAAPRCFPPNKLAEPGTVFLDEGAQEYENGRLIEPVHPGDERRDADVDVLRLLRDDERAGVATDAGR